MTSKFTKEEQENAIVRLREMVQHGMELYFAIVHENRQRTYYRCYILRDNGDGSGVRPTNITNLLHTAGLPEFEWCRAHRCHWICTQSGTSLSDVVYSIGYLIYPKGHPVRRFWNSPADVVIDHACPLTGQVNKKQCVQCLRFITQVESYCSCPPAEAGNFSGWSTHIGSAFSRDWTEL